jgi:hypothetical protein
MPERWVSKQIKALRLRCGLSGGLTWWPRAGVLLTIALEGRPHDL